MLVSFSAVDSFEGDFQQRFPLAAKAKYLEFDQLPGDLLIIPTGWFHQVLILVFRGLTFPSLSFPSPSFSPPRPSLPI